MKSTLLLSILFLGQFAAADISACLNVPGSPKVPADSFEISADGKIVRKAPFMSVAMKWDEVVELEVKRPLGADHPDKIYRQKWEFERRDGRITKITVKNDPETFGPALKAANPKPGGDGGMMFVETTYDLSYDAQGNCHIEKVLGKTVSLYYGGPEHEFLNYNRADCPKHPQKNADSRKKTAKYNVCTYFGQLPTPKEKSSTQTAIDFFGSLGGLIAR